MYSLAALLIGCLFGVGLVISNMVNPIKVLNFLDVTGHWDPSLILVMIAAVITTAIGFYWVNKLKKPVLTQKFDLPKNNKIDKELILGSAIFGIGWGLAGYCPGPSFSALGIFRIEVLYFLMGMIAGSIVYLWLSKIIQKG
jgi:uncharacterized membrane protein YedE/YeeE